MTNLCALLLLLALAVPLAAQDWASALAPAKGKRCEVFLKSGEVRKGKLKEIGEDYITVEVKLSPFYAEPQTFRITQVNKVDYGRDIVDVAALLAQAQRGPTEHAVSTSQVPSRASTGTVASQPVQTEAAEQARTRTVQPATVAQGEGSRQTTRKTAPAAKRTRREASESEGQPDDKTVKRLMAILKSLDEKPKTTGGQQAKESAKPSQAQISTSRSEARQETSSASMTAPSSEPEQAEKVVVPIRRREITPTPVALPKVEAKSQRRGSGVRKPRSSSSTEIPARKREEPTRQAQKSRLAAQTVLRASSSTQRTKSPGMASETQDVLSKEASSSEEAAGSKLAQGGESKNQPEEAEMVVVARSFQRAAVVLAGAVVVLALGVILLAVVVSSRRRRERSVKPSAEGSSDTLPAQAVVPPIRVVMVKGDYAVVDQGFEQGMQVGELLLVKRAVEDGDYEIGLVKVLKAFDRLSGVKMIEHWVETELRVGDLARKYQPAEPEEFGVDATVVGHSVAEELFQSREDHLPEKQAVLSDGSADESPRHLPSEHRYYHHG